jgi:hypothetical protein
MKTFVLSLAAGILGGILSHYAWMQPVLAQSQAAPSEVRAQSFALVNDKGEVQAVFSSEEAKDGRSTVKLLDRNGREIWSAGGPQVRPLGSR